MDFDSFKQFPSDYNQQKFYWESNAQAKIANYTNNKSSFLAGCQPHLAIQMPSAQVIYLLSKRFGEDKVRFCLNPDNTFDSPVATNTDTAWIKSVTMVGVNVRTIGSFWNVVKYALTLPSHQSSIHLLPIWECGVVASLYGMASWYINNEFFDRDIISQFPHLNTVEKQLKVTINLLHLMGKTVGMDVVPHADRYSEIALTNPHYFEWLQRKDFTILDHSVHVVQKVQQAIVEFVIENQSASGDYFPRNYEDFFDNNQISEEVRQHTIFGKKENSVTRLQRRNALISYLFSFGYEPVPATMAPPYRGLIVDPSDGAKTVDNDGRVWRDYLIEKPQEMSRVFGPLARYSLYETVSENSWELNFNKPKTNIFEYVAQKYAQISDEFNFDFMRGDMSHVQMNPNVTDSNVNQYYDIHKFVKGHINSLKPYFGYFAESFLVADNIMAYGNEAKHLELSAADTTLGNLQSIALCEQEFLEEFVKYYEFGLQYSFKPNFTVFTADKDDPRFDAFYWEGNEVRHFLATFFKFFPSYSSLGFEIRDEHLQAAPNEHYTKLYVFQISEGPKATHGPYHWGQNGPLFANISQINCVADNLFQLDNSPIFSNISDLSVLKKDKVISWQLAFGTHNFLFIATLKLQKANIKYDLKGFSNCELSYNLNSELSKTGDFILLESYSCAIFKL
jgi:hypothetical protein